MHTVSPPRETTEDRPEQPRPGPLGPRKGVRIALHLTWMLALAVVAELRIGRFGFHPSDPGFILAQSRRLLGGDIPHTDAISARPLGSAVLHMVDFAIPGPLFVMSGILAMFEIILGTVAVAVLVSRKPLTTWGPGLAGLTAAAALINLNTFPLTAWHTIDGIMLTACGLWALDSGLRSGRALPRLGGLFLLGVASFVKQSFVLAVVIGALWLLLHPATRAGALRTARWWRRTVLDLLVLGAFPLGYVAVVALDGGFGAMVDQVTGGKGAFGERLLTMLLAGPAELTEPPLRKVTLFAVGALVLVIVRLLRSKLGTVGAVLDRLLVLGAFGLVVWTVASGQLIASTRWADLLWWTAAVAFVANAVGNRRVSWAGLAVLGIGFMTTLSWGNDTPTLAAGSLALTAVLLLAEGMSPLPRAALERPDATRRTVGGLVAGTAFGLAVVTGAGVLVVGIHDRSAYLDLSHDRLTEDLGDVTPAMSGIRTNPATHEYIAQIGDCLRRYPASKVAVLPDNPFAYAAFDLNNPFPLEWPLPLEIVADAPQRMHDTATRLNTEGDYLVLFQTFNTGLLANGGPLPTDVRPETPVFSYIGMERDLHATLVGKPIACGSLVGKWAQ